MIAELFAKYKSWFLTIAALLLLIFAGLGLKSCARSVKESLCKPTESSSSSSESFW